MADSLKKDWGPLLAYICRAHHRCVDCRWILCPQLGGKTLGNFGNQTSSFFLLPQPFLFISLPSILFSGAIQEAKPRVFIHFTQTEKTSG